MAGIDFQQFLKNKMAATANFLLTQNIDDVRSIKGKVMTISSPNVLYGYKVAYRISPSISREIYPRTKYYTDNSSYTRVTPSGKKLYQKQVEFSKFGRNMTEQW